MPELPEVETIKNQLNQIFPLKINSFDTSNVVSSIVHTKLDGLNGKTILMVNRKGKMLDFLIDDKRHLLSHLGLIYLFIFVFLNNLPYSLGHSSLQFFLSSALKFFGFTFST